MRTVHADIDYVELEGDYREVEGVCATCTRCGHETESFGISDASIRRCLALLREECPRGEVNFYEAGRSSKRKDFDAGYEAGQRDAHLLRSPKQIDAELLRDLVQLAHPDRHPPERAALANRATAWLINQLEEIRRAV